MNCQTPSTRQVLLGLFIAGQIFFLISTNLIGFLKDNRTEMGPETRQVVETLAPGWPEEKGHLWHLMDQLAKIDTIWAQTTGQIQTWLLFAPTIGRECVFPAMELRWDDEAGKALHKPELLLSQNEPADPNHFLRIGNFRMRRFECNFILTLRPYEDEAPEKTKERWSGAIRTHVKDYEEIIRGFLSWWLGQAMSQWPSREQPRQAILIFRRYHINDYGVAPPYWDGPFDVPIARWQSAKDGPLLDW